MGGDEGAFVLCLNVLRWSGLSFTKVQMSPRGDLLAEDSTLHLLVNVAVAGVFLFEFFRVDPNAYAHAEETYKSSGLVYPLYTKLMILATVALSICGNVYNRKFVDLVNLFCRTSRRLERDAKIRRKSGNGRRVLFGFLVYLAVSTVVGLWVDLHLTVHYEWLFLAVHYFSFCYVTLFTAHFVITMNYARENFRFANAAFLRIVRTSRRPPSISATISGMPTLGMKIRGWMQVLMELREVEEMANEVFGKQIFLILLLVFSSVCVNSYYFITLNLYGTSNLWLNVTVWLGFLHSVIAAFVNTRAAELAVNEANRVSEMVLCFPFHFNDWRMYKRIKYFAFFTHYYPMKLKAWIFYAINYDSLLKVILTSSAITTLILQCDFLRGSLEYEAAPSTTPTQVF